MDDPRIWQPPSRALLERRAATQARRHRRRLAAGSLLAVLAASALIALGAVDRPAHHASLRAVAPAAAAPPAARPIARDVRMRRMEDRAVERTLKRTPYVAVAGRRRREIALTFDDGPGPYTLAVVSVLRRLRVPATFFQVGSMIHYFPAAERLQAHDPDVVVGDHTQSHPMLGRMPQAVQASQITQQAQDLRRAGLPYPRLFRPPYGSYNRATLSVLHRLGMLMILWTIDTDDFRQPGVGAIVSRVLRGARPGAIVLLHDGGGTRTQTVAALPQIVSALRRRGYQFVTVPRLLRDDPPPRRQPKIAFGAG